MKYLKVQVVEHRKGKASKVNFGALPFSIPAENDEMAVLVTVRFRRCVSVMSATFEYVGLIYYFICKQFPPPII